MIDEAQLKLFLMYYTTINLKANTPMYDPRLPDAIRKLEGRPVTVCVLLRGLPPGDSAGNEPAIRALRTLGDIAAKTGVRISIYHHTGDWTETFAQALRIAEKTDHPQVGVNFNLCHWLKVDGDKDYRPLLRKHIARVFAVTINGAQRGADTWTNGLIQPLDRGNFDNRELLKTLREAGYRGPIGLMCYGLPGDPRESLERSMKVWRGEALW